MIDRQKGQMVFIKHEFKPRPYWVIEWSMDPAIGAGSVGTDDTFWIIDAEGNSRVVSESDLCVKPPVAIFGEINER
jgi:hypothetical protein